MRKFSIVLLSWILMIAIMGVIALGWQSLLNKIPITVTIYQWVLSVILMAYTISIIVSQIEKYSNKNQTQISKPDKENKDTNVKIYGE